MKKKASVIVHELRRTRELQKYDRAYSRNSYKMGGPRMIDSIRDVSALPSRGSYLDVGCGRGEMLAAAEAMGFSPVQGVDACDAVVKPPLIVKALIHELPFPENSFDVVTCFDVLEHLLPPDDEKACAEMLFVARKHILLSVNNKSSMQKNGDELHVNRRPYEVWEQLFRDWFTGHQVTRLAGHEYVSETFRVDI